MTCLSASFFLAGSLGEAATLRREARRAGFKASNRTPSLSSMLRIYKQHKKSLGDLHQQEEMMESKVTSGWAVLALAALAFATCKSSRFSMVGMRADTAALSPEIGLLCENGPGEFWRIEHTSIDSIRNRVQVSLQGLSVRYEPFFWSRCHGSCQI